MKIKINKNLYLRSAKLADAQDIFAFASNKNVTKFLTYVPHKTIDDTLFLLKKIWPAHHDKLADLVIVFKNKVIGTCNITPNKKEKYNELGYQLHHDYWKKGIMTHVVNAFIKFYFKKRKEKLLVWAHPENIGSWNLINKLNIKPTSIIYSKFPQINTLKENQKYFFEILR